MTASHQADQLYLLIRDSFATDEIEEEDLTEGDIAYARVRTLIAQAQCEEKLIPDLRNAIMDLPIALVRAFDITPRQKKLWRDVTELPYKLMEILSWLLTPNATPIAT